MRRKTAPKPSRGCAELDAASELDPAPITAAGCQECLELGVDTWTNLRLCVACGHVGCCDSSQYRHSTGHHESSGHPVMRSFEPGETWRWCFGHNRIG